MYENFIEVNEAMQEQISLCNPGLSTLTNNKAFSWAQHVIMWLRKTTYCTNVQGKVNEIVLNFIVVVALALNSEKLNF